MNKFTPGFRSSGKGFHLTFDNGWTLSVQFGYGNYCENYHNESTISDDNKCTTCTNAEIAYIDPEGNLDYNPDWSDQVLGYCSPSDVVNHLFTCSRLSYSSRARPFPGLNNVEDSSDG